MLCVALPGGETLSLRPIGPEDDVWLLETADTTTPSGRATALVARCLVDNGDAKRTSQTLTVGDREALLLHLRRATFGDVVEGVLPCPASPCGERMELELLVHEMLLPRYEATTREHELGVDYDGARYEVRFRLPTAADLDQVSTVATSDPDSGAWDLLQCCLLQAARNGRDVSARDLPLGVREAISASMAAKDPQAEIELDLVCPACAVAFSVVFDTATFFLRELDARASQLMRQVHVLATHYHWSERAILGLPAQRRALYLDLVAESAARPRAR